MLAVKRDCVERASAATEAAHVSDGCHNLGEYDHEDYWTVLMDCNTSDKN